SILNAYAFAIPVAFMFGFVCLSAWWVCRTAPLTTTPHGKLATRLLLATVQAIAVGAVLAFAWEAFILHAFGIAPGRIGRAGDFVRRTLNLGARDVVPLADELALVERYLGIERVRFGERLRVERRIDAEAAGCLVPPLLLQPLVENAIKHGVAGRIEGGTVRLSARRLGDRLEIGLENPVDADARSRSGEGLGLDIVRRRLAALGEARLDASRADGLF